jgi:hypothetical protein
MLKLINVVILSYTLYLNPGFNSAVTIPGFTTYEKCVKMGEQLTGGRFLENYKCILVD